MGPGKSRSAGNRIRGRDLMMEMLSGQTDFHGVQIFEEGFNFTADRTFTLLCEYFKSRDFSERKNRVNWEAAQLSDIKAPGLVLPYVLARGANLNFADLTGADFNNADFRRAGFKRAKLARANFSKAYLTGAILSEADLSGASFVDATLNDATLGKANLARANLRGARLKNVRLDDANLENADLTGADLSGASLLRVNLRGANLSQAVCTKAVIKDAQTDEHTRTEGAVHLKLFTRLERPEDDIAPAPPPATPPEEERTSEVAAESEPAPIPEQPAPAPQAVPPAAAPTPEPAPPPAPLAKHFRGAVALDPLRVGITAVRLADRIATPLARLNGAKMKVTLKIEGEFPDGVPEKLAQTVAESCKAMNFDECVFEV